MAEEKKKPATKKKEPKKVPIDLHSLNQMAIKSHKARKEAK